MDIQLGCVFELMQVECSLEGNFLLQDYKKFDILVSHSWMKLLWQYLAH